MENKPIINVDRSFSRSKTEINSKKYHKKIKNLEENESYNYKT